jgi:2-phosphosulfolactate phosphatase
LHLEALVHSAILAAMPEHRFVGNDGCADIGDVAVVVDVLRAFSFAAYALNAGADRLVLMERLDDAAAVVARLPGALAGKDGPPEPGFDLFNSPGQVLERSDLGGRTVVHRTMAGTIGAVAARAAEHLYCASFVVAGATAQRVRDLQPTAVTFVITGDGGQADEDLACAEHIAACIDDPDADPGPQLRRAAQAGERLRRAVELGYAGVHPDDVDLCLDVDRFDFAMRAVDEDGLLTLRKG